jgi:predicted ester cyclase
MADVTITPRHERPNAKESVMRKWKRVALAAALTAATAAGLAGAGVAADAQTAPAGHAGRTATPPYHESVAANIRVVRAFLQDVIDEHHGNHAANYLTKDIQFHAGTVGMFTGRTTVAGLFGSLVTALPDIHANVEDIFGAGNEVLVRLFVNGGIQKSTLLDIPASGRHVQWTAMDLYRLQGGMISAEWTGDDWTAILYDTGTFKAPWIH